MLKKYLSLFYFLLLICCNTDRPTPTGLMVEFIRDTEQTEILDSKPEFTWTVPSGLGFQSSYQIQVASSKILLQNDNPDIWNSGKVKSNKSMEIEFAGPELSQNSNYFWRVKIWDYNNEESNYSYIQSFTTSSFIGYSTTKNKFQKVYIDAKNIVRLSNSKHFIDFGRAAFGTIQFSNIDVKETDTLVIHLGEKINSGNRIDRDPPGNIRYQKVHLSVTKDKKEYQLDLPANNRNTSGAAVLLPDSMGVVFPFRYCEIENYQGNIGPKEIKQVVYHYYFEEDQSMFTSSDTVLNRVWDICKYSMKATSFTGLYVDGDRERIPYEADAYINQLGHYYTDREYSMARLTNEYFIDNPTWPTEWILQTIPMFYNDFMFTGNIESIKNYYDELKWKTLKSLARKDGLISSKNVTNEIMTMLGFSDPDRRIMDIVDWPPGQKDTGWKLASPEGERDGYEFTEINTVVNSFYFYNLKIMSKIAGQLGNTKDSIFYYTESEKVRKTINHKLIDKNTGVYIDGEGSDHSSLHANMFPLAFDLVPETNKSRVVEFIKSRGMACSVYGAQFLLEGLYKAGESDYALELLNATHDRSWWNMIRSGSTITMEAWDMKYKPNSDWNHAWGAAPANIIPAYLWGVRPTTPGFESTVIQPQLSEISYAKITVPTIRGGITAEFQINDGTKEFRIHIPGNMKCYFDPSFITFSIILLNGKKYDSTVGSFILEPGLNTINIH